MNSFYLESSGFDPCRNLAIEEFLLNQAQDAVILYLWQNENTVVIGKNQNPWKECKTTLLAQEGGTLVRRLSGGGAVFHDLGNLNFTFLLPQKDFDVDRQLTVIQRAVRHLGIDAQRSGRNDVLAQGRKFSGNAFYKNGTAAYHHGTLLVEADLEKLGRYLSPSRAKLQSKGVDSVRSRVGNLRELNPEISIENLKEALLLEFSTLYGTPQGMTLSPEDEAIIAALSEKYRSWDWRFGRRLPFSCACESRFPWGSVEIQLQIDAGIVTAAKVYSDAMDESLAPRLEAVLTGSRLDVQTLRPRLREVFPKEGTDLCALLDQLL